MPLYFLDTNTLTLLQHNHLKVAAALGRHGNDLVAVATVNVEEVIGGWFRLMRRAKANAQEGQAAEALAASMALLARFPVYPVTEQILDRFDRLVRLKLNVGRMDLKLGAATLEHGATVVTNNVRDFGRIPGLQWEDWAT